MKATMIEKNGLGLDEVLTRMTRRMQLVDYAESTIGSYSRSVRTLGMKISKSLVNVEEDERKMRPLAPRATHQTLLPHRLTRAVGCPKRCFETVEVGIVQPSMKGRGAPGGSGL